MSMSTVLPSHLSDGELVAAVARLAGSERAATVALIAHLAELYGRRLHERAGFSSLFTYCIEVLHISEQEAYDRMKAAKVSHPPHHRPPPRSALHTRQLCGAAR